MDSETIQRLLELNRQFYQRFAVPFAATRQRLQGGVRRLLPDLLAHNKILDLGCGNGELALQLHAQGYRGQYLGVDFSPGLLAEAAHDLPPGQFTFQLLDLAATDWPLQVPPPFERITAFAVLHHIPGQALRQSILERARQRLALNGRLLTSYWQFMNSPRLVQRVQPWAPLGLDPAQLEPGDTLLDWRAGGEGLRYVHLFSEQELNELAARCGFRVAESFYSDGEGGRLGLYQVWEAA